MESGLITSNGETDREAIDPFDNRLSRFTPGGVNQDRVDFKEIEPSPDSPQGGVNRYIWCNQITAMKQIQ